MKKIRKIAMFLCCFIIIISSLFSAISTAQAASYIFCSECGEKIDPSSKFCKYCGHPVHDNDALESIIGSTLVFGTYEQDDNRSNGKEPIEWQILDIQADKVLVISKCALDSASFSSNQNATWETSSLRSWLNREFWNNAFSLSEQAVICETTVPNDRNLNYDTDPGNSTRDRIFLLSIKEAEKYFSTDEMRKCASSQYSIAQGLITSESGLGKLTDEYKTSDGKPTCWWWLRSPGYNQSYVSYISYVGSIVLRGNEATSGGGAVRPAMWIDLKLSSEEPLQSYTEDATVKTADSTDEDSRYVIGSSENTFAGLYKRMCVNLDLKKNPVPAPDTEEGNYGGGQYEYVKVLKNDSETYEYIGYVRYANDVNRYLVRCWRGYHKDGALIEMDVYYTLDGKYIGNIQRDRTAGTSTSSHNSPYFIPGEPMNHE